MSGLRLAVLGAGSWGTALAALACPRAQTLLWARNPAIAQEISVHRRNGRYLPGIALPDTLLATDHLSQALSHVLDAPAGAGRLIVLGVPMAGLAQICADIARLLPADCPAVHILWTCKGLESPSLRWPDQIVSQALQGQPNVQTGVLSGPSFAREVAQGLPVALTVASHHPATGDITQQAFHGAQARIYTTHDVMGVQVGGALKNIMAIACGISDGLQLGTNARAALITRGLAEIRRLGVALGGQPDTFNGLTGLGDLVLTATGELSRNRQAGMAIGQGLPPSTLLSGATTLEGARCAQAVQALSRAKQLDMPITEAVCSVLFQGLTPREAVAALLSRDPRPE